MPVESLRQTPSQVTEPQVSFCEHLGSAYEQLLKVEPEDPPVVEVELGAIGQAKLKYPPS